MPNRILRDGILTSEAVCTLSWPAEVFYRRLMSVADDHGRFHSLPKLIRAACYPLQIDKVSDADMGKWLTECVTAALVSVYPASDGKRYVQIEKFGQQVRSKSKFPEPTGSDSEQSEPSDSSCYQLHAIAHLDEDEDEVEDVKTPLPPSGGKVLAAAVVERYHAILPNCQRAEAMTPKRLKRIQHADKLARAVCKQHGWDYETGWFWESYFVECQRDPWLRGDVPNPKNPRWRQNLDTLLAEDRFATIMDSALSRGVAA